MGGSGPRNGWVSCRWITPPEERFGCVCKWGIYHGIPQSGNCTWKNPEKIMIQKYPKWDFQLFGSSSGWRFHSCDPLSPPRWNRPRQRLLTGGHPAGPGASCREGPLWTTTAATGPWNHRSTWEKMLIFAEKHVCSMLTKTVRIIYENDDINPISFHIISCLLAILNSYFPYHVPYHFPNFPSLFSGFSTNFSMVWAKANRTLPHWSRSAGSAVGRSGSMVEMAAFHEKMVV